MNESEHDLDAFCETNRLVASASEDAGREDLLHVELSETPPQSKITRIRNLSGFWLLGLCNNYAYVIMLSAAFDIMHPSFHGDTAEEENSTANDTFSCNPISTGAVLLADILPSLGIKLIAPFFISGAHLRVFLNVLLVISSFLLTSLSVQQWMSFLGVICAALATGLGEVTFLAYSSHFERDVVSTYSSGTGGAGIFGALSYAALTAVLSARHTLQVMLVIPILLAATFWLLLVHPVKIRPFAKSYNIQDSNDCSERREIRADPVRQFTFRQKLEIIKPLLKYMIPLSLVYFAEYFINQGLYEIIYFPGIWLQHKDQYKWYQVVYQVGVFVSRSSVNFVKIHKLWILPIIQLGNAVFLLFVAYYGFLPSIWIVFAIILFEGFLGGAAYVNTFYKITKEVPEKFKEFSMSFASLGDAMGIALAGGVALPVHDALCKALTT